MVTVEEASRMAMALPEVTEAERHGARTWFVAGKGFAWERPFSKADVRRFGNESPPDGPILAVRVGDLDDKEVVLATGIRGFFTIPHFNGYAALLIHLNTATTHDVQEAIIDAWHACAPQRLRLQHPEFEGSDSTL